MGPAVLDFLGLGLGIVTQDKVRQEVEQGKERLVVITVELDQPLVEEGQVDWEVAQE